MNSIMEYIGIHKKNELTLSDLIQSMKENADFYKAGAIATFVGVVRGQTLDGERVEKLEIEAYEEQANGVLADICEDLKKRDGIVDVQIHHLIGEFNVGEDLVYVIVAGGHRQNTFRVLQEAVERYKNETPVFKKEYIVDECGRMHSYWINEKGAQTKRRKK